MPRHRAPPQHLAPLAEAGAHELEHAPRRRVGGGRWPPGDGDERRVDVGLGQEHGRRHEAGDLRRRPVGDLDRHRAVGVVAHAGRQPLADLLLHHHEHPLDGGHLVEEIGHQRRGDVVGQVGDEHPPPVAEQRRPVEPHGVALDDPDTRRLDGLPQQRHEMTVDLHRRHRCTGLGQRQRQRTQAGADLDHLVARPDPGQPGDAPDGVGIDDEVLAEGAARATIDPCQQLGHLGPGERHPVTAAATS
jgi:hypothetical protein